MDKNQSTEKAEVKVTSPKAVAKAAKINKEAAKPVVSRYVIQHTHNPADDKPKPKPKQKVDPRIGRAKHLLSQVDLWEAKAKEAEDRVETHPLVEAIEAVKMDTEWLDREINQRTEAAYAKRQGGLSACSQADLHQEEAERLQREARRLREAARVMRSEADALDADNRRAFAQSLQDGPHSKLKSLEKQFNTETHRIAKQGREARRKADKMRDRLKDLLAEIAPLLEEETEGHTTGECLACEAGLPVRMLKVKSKKEMLDEETEENKESGDE